MNSDQIINEKSQKRKKYRKKHLDQKKILTNKKPDQNNEDAKPFYVPKNESKPYVSEKSKISVLHKRKNSKNTSTLISNASNLADTDNKKINSVSNIEEVKKNISEEAVKITLKDVKKIIKARKYGIPGCKNIESKKKQKRVLSPDASFSSSKNLKYNETMSSSYHMSTKKFKNKNKTDVKKNCIFQKTGTGNSSESDSNEDEILRNELKSFSVYKNIQKLIKDNPSLVAASNSNEEESSKIRSVKRLSESEVKELSIKCADTSSYSCNKKSEILSNNTLMSSNKDKVVSRKDFDRTRVHKNKEVVAAGTTSLSCDFDRIQKNTLSNKDKKDISKKIASTLKNKAQEKLQAAKFRYLNEKLYTESGKDSFDYFQKNKDEFMDYHKGYSLQVAKWPLNPVDKIIGSLQKMKKNLIIADMGCGDAKVSRTVSSCSVHSFDLVELNDEVFPCDISKVPLLNESVDVVIFCLSLMGTNLKEYLQEAYRIAKFGGILKIAEVESRIPNLNLFIKSIQSIGFTLQKKDVEHRLFVFLDFEKVKKKRKNAELHDITLKPCLYKKR